MKAPTASYLAALAIGLGLAGSQSFATEPPDARVHVGLEGPQRQYPDERATRPPTDTRPDVARERTDMSRWHRNFDAPRQYRAGAYSGPRDYSYERYGYGQRLPRDYYEQNYWLADFLNFGLLTPPAGFVWVRYGPDALLVDTDTGEIVQVQYNLFYS
jgi:Ni/Co efflux regulator RcnB